jgi:flotillin
MTSILIIVGFIIGGTLALMAFIAQLFRKVGPNEALIVYGFRGTRIVQGGGTVVFPMVEQYQELSLELMSFDVAPEQELYTKQGVAVNVEAVAQIKVKSDRESILTAAERFLSKTPTEREQLIRLVMEGHLRGIIGQLTVESLVKEPETVGDRVRSTSAEDLNKMGLTVDSFTIKRVVDENEYIINMGRPDIAAIKREADIAIANAERDTAIARARSELEASRARSEADQNRVSAQTASETVQSNSQRDLELQRAQNLAQVQTRKAEADKSYEIATNIAQQRVAAEAVKIEIETRKQQVVLQKAEVERREQELIATVVKAAEAEQQRVQIASMAEKQRLVTVAEGRAAAITAEGQAEAGVILAKGTSDAEARRLLGAAYAAYGQAAIVDRVIALLPEIVSAMTTPLSHVDKITVVSTGAGEATGVHKLTGDLTKMAAEVPALLETLSGINLRDFLGHISGIREQSNEPAIPSANDHKS